MTSSLSISTLFIADLITIQKLSTLLQKCYQNIYILTAVGFQFDPNLLKKLFEFILFELLEDFVFCIWLHRVGTLTQH